MTCRAFFNCKVVVKTQGLTQHDSTFQSECFSCRILMINDYRWPVWEPARKSRIASLSVAFSSIFETNLTRQNTTRQILWYSFFVFFLLKYPSILISLHSSGEMLLHWGRFCFCSFTFGYTQYCIAWYHLTYRKFV